MKMMKSNDSPIFLLGSERSGSNLLRTLIGNHEKVSAPVAPHFCDAFSDIFHKYKPLDDGNRKELLLDLEKYANHEYNNWKLTLDYDLVVQKYKLNSFIDFLHAVYLEHALNNNHTTYFSKDNHNHRHALGILKDVPNAKFLYLYRDPRDHVASWLRTPLYMHTPHKIISKWQSEQQEILKLNSFYNLPMCFVKYEDLIVNTKNVVVRILDFVGLNVDASCFETKKDVEEANRNPFWKNLNKPVMADNRDKYTDVLKGINLNMVESLAKSTMDTLGYVPTTSQDWKVGNRYWFWFAERFKTRRSRRKHKELKQKEMASMFDKTRLRKELFSKFNA